MSRLAQGKSTPMVRRDGPRPTSETPDGELQTRHLPEPLEFTTDRLDAEICPVCKTSRYMRPTMRLLINPSCYHKMCESCVDRIFSHGPAPCPSKGCDQTLRKNRFRQQTFEDIKVEREVDIRKSVAQVFNRREEDFETLKDYNDYLNEVEDITFNLINGIDEEEARKKLIEHKELYENEIRENASLAQKQQFDYVKLQKAEKEQAKQRREAARREEAEERRETEASRRDMLRRLENGQDPEQVAKERQQIQLKRRTDRRAAEQRQADPQAASQNIQGGSGDIVIKGLKTKAKAEPEKPVDPFDGLSFTRQYYAVQDLYVWSGIAQPRKDILVGAGGYDVTTFTNRALCEAFSGLGVMIADEAMQRERMAQEGTAVTTKDASEVAAKDVKMEDPF
ncbi:RNA polymerase II transcription factor B subunit 3 [Lecanosticta acicola]|uniref:RNA polymerase II transcription factor B subunit 3 n=1 Tax=Lecanosticta acicola TaxID=111012 RepID=A0AAI9EEL8_9PEZI|nr:RNA polymerase II transcription factor B subunit 3 [Lecanosticta acicola]